MGDRNKRFETYCLSILRRGLPGFPTGEVLPSESPDFLISTDQGLLGIEVTRLVKAADVQGNIPRAREGEQAEMIKVAMRFYETLSLPPVDVAVIFGNCGRLSKRERDKSAKILSRFVASHVPEANQVTRHENDNQTHDGLPEAVHSVRIARLVGTENLWHVSGSGWFQKELVEELQAVMRKKDARHAGFDNRAVAHWLLVVIEGTSDSTFFDPSEESLTHCYESDFQRVFLLDLMRLHVSELKLRGAA